MPPFNLSFNYLKIVTSGLQLLHELTGSGSYRLRVDLKDWEGEQRYADYS